MFFGVFLTVVKLKRHLKMAILHEPDSFLLNKVKFSNERLTYCLSVSMNIFIIQLQDSPSLPRLPFFNAIPIKWDSRKRSIPQCLASNSLFFVPLGEIKIWFGKSDRYKLQCLTEKIRV